MKINRNGGILFALVLMLLNSGLSTFAQNPDKAAKTTKAVKAVKKKKVKQEGTNYSISNQTNVLVVWMNGSNCSAGVAGEIYPDKPLTIFIEKGGKRVLTFAARHSNPKCHCYTVTLTSDGETQQYINLKLDTFCN